MGLDQFQEKNPRKTDSQCSINPYPSLYLLPPLCRFSILFLFFLCSVSAFLYVLYCLHVLDTIEFWYITLSKFEKVWTISR